MYNVRLKFGLIDADFSGFSNITDEHLKSHTRNPRRNAKCWTKHVKGCFKSKRHTHINGTVV